MQHLDERTLETLVLSAWLMKSITLQRAAELLGTDKESVREKGRKRFGYRYDAMRDAEAAIDQLNEWKQKYRMARLEGFREAMRLLSAREKEIVKESGNRGRQRAMKG